MERSPPESSSGLRPPFSMVMALALGGGFLGGCVATQVSSPPSNSSQAEEPETAIRFPASRRPETRAVEIDPVDEAFIEMNFFAEGRGLVVSPHLVKFYDRARESNFLWPYFASKIEKRWGAIATDDRRIVGLNVMPYEGTRAGALGCAVCHAGKAAGQFVPGLGNKNFDVYQAGQDYRMLFRFGDRFLGNEGLNEKEQDLRIAGRDYAQAVSNLQLGNVTQGLVPVGIVFGWFYTEAGDPIPSSMTAGAVKVPHLWGYAQKRAAGFFCDAAGDGNDLAWNTGVDLTAGQRPETIRAIYPRIVESQKYLRSLSSPDYPFEIREERVKMGQGVFEQNCRKCHGSYRRDAKGNPLFEQPRWVPLARVGTDPERLDIKTTELIERFNTGPLRDLMGPKNAGRGYFAPRLEGIWARFPYLHNASVPTLEDLLSPAEQRPQAFSLVDAGEAYRFDPDKVGLTHPGKGSLPATLLGIGAALGERRSYATSRLGHSNQGHEFGTDLPEEDRRALLEYLKTL